MTEQSNLKDAQVLIVDDTPANIDVLCELLEPEGCNIAMAPSGEIALRIVPRSQPDIILLDVMMPGMNGYEVCRQLKADPNTENIPIVFITAQSETAGVIEGFRAGGVDYITKPFQGEEVLVRVKTHLRINQLTREVLDKNRALAEETAQRHKLKGQLSMISQREAEHWGLEGFIGNSPTMGKIFKEIRLMQDAAKTSVLINGESGTGKELIARAIHFGGDRGEGPFVPVNCAALPRELAESLLFGHSKGAFTGADSDKVGYFEMADQGTLFLDELGEMPLELQAKLLRVLEDGEVQRIGEKKGRKVDVRVVAATNVEMQEHIREGGFRQDLYFRLARFTVTAPPLRDRREDIPLLADHFLRLFAEEMGREVPVFSVEALALLQGYHFLGNVRELKNIVERALIESMGGQIRPEHLHLLGPEKPTGASGQAAPALPAELPLDLELAERMVIKKAIAACDGNISEAARLLKTHRNRIYRAMAQEEETS